MTRRSKEWGELSKRDQRASLATYFGTSAHGSGLSESRDERAGLAAITLALPWPPSTNRYWRHVGAKVLISAEGRAYRRAVAQHVQIRTTGLWSWRFGPEARLAVQVEAYPPDRRRRDLDNLLKALLDALEHAGLYPDDAAIDDLRVTRGEVRPAGQVVVRISIAGAGEAEKALRDSDPVG